MPKGGPTDKIIDRMAHVYRLVESHGCVTTTTIMNELGLSHTEAYYASRLLSQTRNVVKVVVGKTAIWCKDWETAEHTLDALVSAMRRLLCASDMRYATPTRVVNLIILDRQAFKLFAKYIQLDRTKRLGYRPVALTFIDALLRRVGDPVRNNVYYVTC